MNALISDVSAHLVTRDAPDRGFMSRDLNIILITFSLLFFGVRCYSRFFVLKNPGVDDAIIGLALVRNIQNESSPCLRRMSI